MGHRCKGIGRCDAGNMSSLTDDFVVNYKGSSSANSECWGMGTGGLGGKEGLNYSYCHTAEE